jgi:protein-S-isoprenylcysteine O-methyltransferase Ste14
VSFIPALADTCIILHHARDLAPSNWVDKIDSLPFGSYRSPVGTPLVIVVGATMAVAGVGLRRWAMATLGRHFTLELTLQPTHKLMTSAPYNIVRHPSYTGGMMALGGALLAFCAPADGWFRAVWLAKLTHGDFNLIQGALGWGATTLLGCIFTLGVVNGVSRTRIEDSMLRERFGKDWDVWAKRVPYKLVPFVY